MSGGLYTQLLDLACGGFLLAAVIVLWRRELASIIRVFALQGVALAAIAVLLGAHEGRGTWSASVSGSAYCEPVCCRI